MYFKAELFMQSENLSASRGKWKYGQMQEQILDPSIGKVR